MYKLDVVCCPLPIQFCLGLSLANTGDMITSKACLWSIGTAVQPLDAGAAIQPFVGGAAVQPLNGRGCNCSTRF